MADTPRDADLDLEDVMDLGEMKSSRRPEGGIEEMETSYEEEGGPQPRPKSMQQMSPSKPLITPNKLPRPRTNVIEADKSSSEEEPGSKTQKIEVKPLKPMPALKGMKPLGGMKAFGADVSLNTPNELPRPQTAVIEADKSSSEEEPGNRAPKKVEVKPMKPMSGLKGMKPLKVMNAFGAPPTRAFGSVATPVPAAVAPAPARQDADSTAASPPPNMPIPSIDMKSSPAKRDGTAAIKKDSATPRTMGRETSVDVGAALKSIPIPSFEAAAPTLKRGKKDPAEPKKPEKAKSPVPQLTKADMESATDVSETDDDDLGETARKLGAKPLKKSLKPLKALKPLMALKPLVLPKPTGQADKTVTGRQIQTGRGTVEVADVDSKELKSTGMNLLASHNKEAETLKQQLDAQRARQRMLLQRKLSAKGRNNVKIAAFKPQSNAGILTLKGLDMVSEGEESGVGELQAPGVGRHSHIGDKKDEDKDEVADAMKKIMQESMERKMNLAAANQIQQKKRAELLKRKLTVRKKAVQASQEVVNRFRRFDVNNDSLIDINDLRTVMQKLGYKAKDAELKAMLELADLDSNDGVNIDNFKTLNTKINEYRSLKESAAKG